MATSLLQNMGRSDLYVCARCVFKASRLSNNATRRWIGTKYLAKVADAEVAWKEKAREIKAGKQKSMFSILKERGLIQQTTGTEKEVEALMTNHRIGAYVGIDPTAASLHIGHLLPLMSLFWMYIHGYHTVTLLGGATSKIGDPTDRLTTREKQHAALRTENMTKMHYQLKAIWLNVEEYARKYGWTYEWAMKRGLHNNNAWMNKLSLMEFLQVVGPGMRMGAMMAKDTVKNKMTKGDGMSFAEFTYPLLQAWDWWHMHDRMGISMQIGGSDQYGNITAGIDAVKYIRANHPDPAVTERVQQQPSPFGFTVPLLTTSSGEKFGKSAGNALWLDKEMMSSFDLYGHFLRTSDEDVAKYLKLFTFRPIEEIDTLVEEHMKEPSKRVAQHALAKDFLELVHGVEFSKAAEAQHRLLHTKPQDPEAARLNEVIIKSQLDPANITAINRPTANIQLPHSFIFTRSIGKILYACGLASSNTDGHRLALSNSVYVSGQPDGFQGMKDSILYFSRVKLWKNEDTLKYLVDGKLLILRKGKSNIRIIEVVPDSEWEASQSKFPGSETYDPEKSRQWLREQEKAKERESRIAKEKENEDEGEGAIRSFDGEYLNLNRGPKARFQPSREEVLKLRSLGTLSRERRQELVWSDRIRQFKKNDLIEKKKSLITRLESMRQFDSADQKRPLSATELRQSRDRKFESDEGW